MIENLFAAVEVRDESHPLALTERHRIGVVLVTDTLPSANELARRGKNVTRVKERWLSLRYEWPPVEVFQVSRYPGTRRHGLLAMFRPPLRRFVSWGDLRSQPIGKWTDVQMIEEQTVIGFSVREEDCVFRLRPGVAAPKTSEAYGELSAVSEEWIRYLIE